MFSNTAYEAMYQYLGLVFHTKSIQIITSQKVFLGLIVIIFGFMFFATSVEFFSKYMPGVLVRRRHVPLSKYVKVVFCLFLAISFLRVGATTSVKRFNGESWHDNQYIRRTMNGLAPEHRVSFLFDLMSRSAEEFAALVSRVVDSLFGSTHSQLDTPNFFFKAIMYAGATSIDDPKLQNTVKYYTEECFDRFLPYIKQSSQMRWLDKLYQTEGVIDGKLAEIVLETHDKRRYTCLDLKNEVRDGLRAYAIQKGGGFGSQVERELKKADVAYAWGNLQTSSTLVNYYLDQRESVLGIQKGAELPTTAGSIAQRIIRFFSIDGFLGAVGGKDYQAVSLAASRSQDFSENLARAPHVAGFIKMIAIGIFPWLMFLLVAGYWRVLVYWWVIYLSVLLWTPLWTLLYHIMVNISMSAEVMDGFRRLTDGISLYSAQLIESRMYHIFAVYSWLQLLTGTLFTGAILFFLRPALSDTEAAEMPDAVGTAGTVASVGGKAMGIPTVGK